MHKQILSPILISFSIFFCVILFAGSISSPELSLQNIPYGEQWEKVDSLKEKGLNRSALQLVLEIEAQAFNDQEYPQFVKATLYRAGLEAEFEEDALEKSITRIEQKTTTTPFPAKQVLHSILAELYWRYYAFNRYQFLERTPAADTDTGGIATWDLQRLSRAVSEHYRMSLLLAGQLQEIPVNSYDAVIIPGDSTGRALRPTLYDFLAHRAIDHFLNQESMLTEPAYKFEMTDPELMSDVEHFTSATYTHRDSTSRLLHALQLFDELLTFRLKDTSVSALVDADLKRLQFVYHHGVFPGRDQLYAETLKSMLEKYRHRQAEYAKIAGTLALFYHAQGVSDKDDSAFVKAWELCQDVRHAGQGKESYCDHLLTLIEQKELHVEAERVVLPGKPFLISTRYRNIEKVHFRIIESTAENIFNQTERDSYRRLIEEGMVAVEWQTSLPKINDFRDRLTEVPAQGLPSGAYLLVASTDSLFRDSTHTVAIKFQVSELALTTIRTDSKTTINVRDRVKGSPLKKVTVQTWEQRYNERERSYEFVKGTQYRTGADGSVALNSSQRNRSLFIQAISKGDTLSGPEPVYTYVRDQGRPVKHKKTWFFTDRAIYRPGQPVHFKGLMVESDGESSKILVNEKLTVTFYDVNRQVLEEKTFRTNDFGTFSGTFITPEGTLNGTMQLRTATGNTWIRVEEYKRPRFEVSFNPVTGSYRIGDTVTVTGKAISYSGVNLGGAAVRYRVVRGTRFPFDYWGRISYPVMEEMQIASGTVTAAADGNFLIPFTAIPDLSVDAAGKPVFHYTVFADVTDQSGETRSNTTMVMAGYQSLLLDAEVSKTMIAQDTTRIKISAVNLNQVPQPTMVTVKVHKLVPPDKVYHDRYWQEPDTHLLTEKNFRELFPRYPYRSENVPENFEKGSQVFSVRLNTGDQGAWLNLPVADWQQGHYLVSLEAVDTFEVKVNHEEIFLLANPESKKIAAPVPVLFSVLRGTAEPGGYAEFLIGSGWSDVEFNVYTETAGEVELLETVTVNRSQQLLKVPVKESHRGNFTVTFTTIRHNRVYIEKHTVVVPYTNRLLDIKLETFREKMRPGAEEKWTMKVSGKHGDKVLAEVAAAMYDASLDAFTPHQWHLNLLRSNHPRVVFDDAGSFGKGGIIYAFRDYNHAEPPEPVRYDRLNWFGFESHYRRMYRYAAAPLRTVSGIETDAVAEEVYLEADKVASDNAVEAQEAGLAQGGESAPESTVTVTPRQNLRETAFFYPHQETDEEGNVNLSFTMPEALTRWKMLALAHTRELRFGLMEQEFITQKELMVTPNIPRFLRQGDTIVFTARIDNLADTTLTGEAGFLLADARSMRPVQRTADNIMITPSGHALISATFVVPDTIQALVVTASAVTSKHTDAEQHTIPVLANRMLVTETLPLPVRGQETKTFRFESLLNTRSSTLKHHAFTLEFTSNPAWYAVQALPYLMEYPYECSEQLFNRYYANAIAGHIISSSPAIRQVFEQWKIESPESLLSALEKNQELKQIILTETPWVLQAQNETERKNRIALLFDLNKMSAEQNRSLNKLADMQLTNGGFPWFSNMPDNRFITQYIASGAGHLRKLGITYDQKVETMIRKAVLYSDERVREDYERLKETSQDLAKEKPGPLHIQYLYMRSFFPEIIHAERNEVAMDYYFSQAKKHRHQLSRYMQGMLSLILFRAGDEAGAGELLASLKENAVRHDELGMYWKENNTGGYFWHQAPIEIHALMIEAFSEINPDDQKTVDELRLWLLKNKQVNDWRTTKATAEACYALLLGGTSWLATEPDVTIKAGDMVIDPGNDRTIRTEAGTGYFKLSIEGAEVSPSLGNITVTKTGTSPGWGAAYWQYFEELDKIKQHSSPLSVERQLFMESTGDRGPVLTALAPGQQIMPGTKIIVRIVLKSDRTMEYVHMKDMRAAGLEPLNVLSGARVQDGLYYYESTRDASTDFFFAQVPRGTFVFEYPLVVTHKGNFSNGITQVQCMYAPEYASHAEGVRVNTGR